MIYLLNNSQLKKKTIIVNSLSDLPLDDVFTFESTTGSYSYLVNKKLFATISLLPITQNGTEEQVQTIVNNYFKDYEIKKFDNKDFFVAYIIYTMSNK